MIKKSEAAELSFLLLAFVCLWPLRAAGSQTVRAGLYSAPRYAYKNADGSYGGADVEYAFRIAQKAGLNLQIALYTNEKDMLNALDAGEADMLFDFGMNPERESRYLFSENRIGSSALSIYARSGDSRFPYGDIDQLKSRTIGCEDGNYCTELFIKWCGSHGFSPHIRKYRTSGDIDNALDKGEIDAGLIGQSQHAGYTTIMILAPQPYYVLFRKDSIDLKNKVDSAMNQILVNSPLYEEKLLQKYNIGGMGTTGFSPEEIRYIRAHPEITVAVINDDMPYYSQGPGGTDRGIIPDYYRLLAQSIGVEFSYSVFPSNADAIAAVKDGRAQILGMFSDGVITAAKEGILLTDSYENADSVLLMQAGTDFGSIKKVAVKQRSVNNVRQGISSFLNAEIVPVVNAKQGFAALRGQEVDALVCGLPTATWLLNQTNAAAYSTVILSSIEFDLCGATDTDNPILVSILDKAINATEYSFDGIVEKNTMQEHNWQTVIARIPPIQLAGISILFVFIILFLIIELIIIIRKQKEKALVDAAKAENVKKELELEAIEKNTEVRNQFFSNISHDMRTPLNAIIGFIRLAQKDGISAGTRREYLNKAESSSCLLLELINDTLTISKASNGKMELHPSPCWTADLVEAVVSPSREAAEKKHIRLAVDTSAMPNKCIMADKLSIEKIFLNLLTNAIKYTPDGGHIKYTVVQEKQDSDSLRYTVSVADDGIGMAPEFIPHAFEPFSQEKRSSYEYVGTGLGLSIVKQLVELMKGSIEIQSTKDSGTVFTVRLQFSPGIPQAAEEVSPAQGRSVELAGRKILLCEDNQLNREIATALLLELGMRVETAENGREGIDRFLAGPPGSIDAVLMDLRMPILDGLAAAKQIRRLDRADAGTVPIIAMTADAFDDDVQKCLKAGMNAHIAKPIDKERLRKVLQDCIAAR